MNSFDILGPGMVGPSSSHTAGAASIGYITRKLLGRSAILQESCWGANRKKQGSD